MRDPKLTFLIRCAYGAVWLALIWLMVRYVLVWLLPFLIALALAALLEPAVDCAGEGCTCGEALRPRC